MPAQREPGSAAEWMALARGHLVQARAPKLEGAFWEFNCFHAQQAAELALKAVHQHFQFLFRRTHNLEDLCDRLEQEGTDVPNEVREAVALNLYAYATRYPREAEAITEQDRDEAVRLAETVIRWAEALIGVRIC